MDDGNLNKEFKVLNLTIEKFSLSYGLFLILWGIVISFISKSANPSTRTYKIEATIENSNGTIREGLSADMFVPLREVIAHLIPSYLISLNDEGDLGIKILTNNIVQFTEIQIVEDTIDGLWVTGLPKNVTIITVGQEYVINGQEVEVQMLN